MLMHRISTFDEYRSIIQQTKKLPSLYSNCFFLPQKIVKLIEEKRLLAAELPNGVIFLEAEKGFYRCFYFITGEKEPERLILDKPAVAEFIYNNALNDRQSEEIRLIEKMGFSLGRISGRMTLESESVLREGTDKALFAEPKDMKKIEKLFMDTFNPLYSYLPDKKELSAAIEDNKVFAVTSGETLCAALLAETDKSNAVLRLLAVFPEYRRQGMGERLVRCFHSMYADKVKNFTHWVDMKNAAAIKLYENFGYTFEARRANEYVIK